MESRPAPLARRAWVESFTAEQSAKPFPPRSLPVQPLSRQAGIALVFFVEMLAAFLAFGAYWYFWGRQGERPARVSRASAPGARVELPPVLRDPGDNRPILLQFLDPTSECAAREAPKMQRLLAAHGAQVRFLSVLEGANVASLAQRYRGLGSDAPCILDADGQIASRCGVTHTPRFALLDAQGRLHFSGHDAGLTGVRDRTYLQEAIEALLAGRSPPPPPAAATVTTACDRRIAVP